MIDFDKEENKNKWNISILQERKYWEAYLIKNFIFILRQMPQCKNKKIKIGNRNR